jgi:hypothetical protein
MLGDRQWHGAARALDEGLPTRPVVAGRASPCDQGGTNGATDIEVTLGGRATSVPFTAVLIGTQRTTMDNAEASSTCTVLSSRRSQSCPIWLWERGVAG